MADYRISAILSLKDQLTSKLKSATNAIKNITSATANVERGIGGVSKGISSVSKGIGDFRDQNLKLRLGVEGLERVERLKGAIEAARAGKAINIRANDEATSRLQRIKSELQSLVAKPWTALVNIKDNARAALGKMKTGVGEMVGGAAMGMGATMLGTAGIGYGAVNAIQSQMNFEKQMSSVKAIYSGSYKGEELDSVMATLTEAAEHAGATTKFTAKEAGEALYYFGMAGWKPEQAAAGLMPTLNLAAAGNAELGLTADILSDSMTGFQLKAGQYITNSQGKKVEASAYYADLMGALVTHANTDIPMLGETLKYASSVIGAMYADQSAEAKLLGAQDTMLLAGTMANAGIKSSQAGTTIRSLFTRTGSQNRNAFFAMEEALGIKTADEHGNVRRIKDVFADLRKAFNEGMDVDKLLDFEEFLSETKIHADTRRKLEGFLKGAQANGGKISGNDKMKLAAMINGQEGMSGFLAAVLSADWDNIDDALDHAEGTVAKMAAIQRDNLAGSITIMGSAWDAFQRNLVKGDASKGLRSFVDSVTDTLNKANELFKDGIDIGDFGTIIIDVIAKLKAKFLELDGIGSILAGGALIMGMKKILTMALSVKDTLNAWSKVRSAGDVGGMIRGGKGAGAGGLSSVGAMNVRAGSVSIRAAVVNVSGAVRGLNGGNGGVGGNGGRGGAVSVNQQRVNDYYNRRQQILNPTRPTTVPPVVPPSAPPAATGKVASVLKAGGGAGALAAVFGVMDVMAARSQGEYALQTAQSELEYERGQLKILREQEADVTQLNDQVAKIRALEAKVSQTQELNVANERRAIGGAGGMIAGTMAGAALGSILPVVGTAIGGLIGGIIGGILGQSAGEAAADKYTELDNARREGIAQSQGVGGTGEASWGDFRRIQDTGYAEQSVKARAERERITSEVVLGGEGQYGYAPHMAERQTRDFKEVQRSARMEDSGVSVGERMRHRHYFEEQRQHTTDSAAEIARREGEKDASELFSAYRTERDSQKYIARIGRKNGAFEITRQQAAGYSSLNADTGTTGLEGFGVMKTAEQVNKEVAERRRATNLMDEFDWSLNYGNRQYALNKARDKQGSIVERMREAGSTETAPRENPIDWSESNAKINEPFKAREWKGIGSDFDTSKITPTNPREGLSKYGGQKTGLENYGVKQGETADGKPFSLDDLLFNKAAASPVSEAAETGVGGMPEVNASENISSTLDGLESVKSKVGEVSETLSTGLESAKTATAENFDGIGETISTGLETASTTFDNFKNAAGSKFDELSSTASETFSGFSEKISVGLESANETFDSFKTAASTSFDEITASVGEKLSSVRDSVTSGITEISASVSTGMESFATLFSAVFESVQTSAATFAESLSTTLSTGFEALTTGVATTFEAISMTASTGLESLQMTAATMLEGVSQSFSAAFEAILASTSATFESLSATISASVSAASAVITSTFSSAAATVQGIWGAIPGFFSGVFGSLGGIAAGAGAAIASGINSGIGMIMGAWESLSGWLSAKISSLASMAANAAASIGIGSNASGTSSWRGGFTTVNEHGGELIILPNGKTITPYATMQEVIAHNYSGSANFNGGFSTVNEHGGELIILPNGETIYPRVTTNNVVGEVAHNYSGTSFFEGGWSEVNGTGSELMYLPRGTRIIPHAATVGILRKQLREKFKEQSHENFLQQPEWQSAAAAAMAVELGRRQAGEHETLSVAEENRRVRGERGLGERRIALDKNAAPAIMRYLRNKELFSGVDNDEHTFKQSVREKTTAATRQAYAQKAIESVRGETERSARKSVSLRYVTKENALAEKISTDSLGNLLNPEYNRVTGDIAHNYGGTSNFEGGFSTVNEHGGEIIQLPNGKAIYPKATVEREIKTDRLGNIRGLDAPSYNRISGGDSLTVRNAKYQAQLKQWRNNREDEHTLAAVNEAAGTGFGRAEFGTARDSGTGKIAGGEGRIQPAIPAETTAVSQNKYSNLRRMSRDFQQTENAVKSAVANRIESGILSAAAIGKNANGGADIERPAGRVAGKNFFEKGVEATNDFFFKLFHPRKYAAKREDIFQQTVNEGAATLNAASDTNVVDAVNSTTKQVADVDWGGALKLILGKKLNRSFVNLGASEYAEKRRAAQANWVANLQQLNPNAPVRTFGMADNPLGIRIQSAGLPTASNSGAQDVFGSINDYFFKIFHPRKYALKKRGDINGLNVLADNVISESDSLAVQKAKREAQIREFNRQQSGRRKNFFEKTWEAIVGFFGGGKKKDDGLKPIVNAAPNPVDSGVAGAKKSADFFQKELPPQARSLDPNRKTQAEKLYAELSAQYAELERLGITSTVEQLQEMRRETGYNAAANSENLEAYRARIEANARDSEALAKIRREAVRELNEAAVRRANTGVEGAAGGAAKPAAADFRTKLEQNARDSEALAKIRRESVKKQLAERNVTVSAESRQATRELKEAAEIRRESERRNTGTAELEKIANNASAKFEQNRRDSEALAKIRRESVKKRLAERNFTVSEESLQVVRELNAAAVAQNSRATLDSSTRVADIRRTAAAENLREIQRLRETGGLDAGNFFNVAGELPMPKLTVPTSEGGTTNSTSNTSNNSSVNMNFGDVNINNGADFEEFMHRLKTLFTQSAVNYAGA